MKKPALLALALAFASIAGAQSYDANGREKVNVETGAVTCSQSTASNLKVDLSGTAANSTAVKVDGSAVTQPVSGTVTATCNAGTNLNTSALALDASVTPIGAKTDAKNTATDTTSVSIVSLLKEISAMVQAPPSQAVTNAGTFATQSASTEADGANVTLGAKADAKSTATDTTAVTIMQVLKEISAMAQAPAALPANQSTNEAQINGVAPSMGNGASGTGVQRVTIANDSTGIVALTTSSAQIGHLEANQSTNLAQVAGATTATAASGVQKVGAVGNAGATLDSTVGAGTAPTNDIVTGAIFNSTAPAPTTGQAMAVQADQAGNERVFPGIALTTLSGWTSGTSVNATQTIYSNSGAGAVLVHLVQTSTISGGAITFEVSYDNSNWVTVPADAVVDPASTTFAQIALPYTLVASTNKPFLIMGKGWQGLRIKLSTAITGSATVTPNYALLPYRPASSVIALSPTAANFNVTTTPPSNASTNLAQVAGTTTATNSGNKDGGTLRVVIATDQPALTNKLLVTPDSVALPANQSVNVSQMNGVTTLMGAGNDGTGAQRVTISSDEVPLPTGASASSTNALVECNLASAASTNSTSCKGSAGNWYGVHAINTTATLYYLRLYNSSSAPTCSSATGFIKSIPIPASATGAGVNFMLPIGVNYGTGIGFCFTGGSSSTDNTNAATGVFLTVFYK